jgi:hypothetical protein
LQSILSVPSVVSHSAEKTQGLGGLSKGFSKGAKVDKGIDVGRGGRIEHRSREKCTVKVWKPKCTKRKLVYGYGYRS